MVPIDPSQLPPTSPMALIARSSATLPDFVLADGLQARLVVARWHRRDARLDGPVHLAQHLLSYCERGGATATVGTAGTWLRARQHAGCVTFLPAGRYERWQLDAPGEVAHLHLYIAPEVLQRVAGDADPSARFTPLMDLRDPWFDGFFRLLGAEYEACQAAGRPESLDLVDRTRELLLRRLVALRPAPAVTESRRAVPLRPHLLRAVLHHVEAHLGERLSLETLAGIASMSVDHFVRAFQQATGSTPHRWIVERRLDTACSRLADSSDRIEQIAHACGFAGAAHFTASFRRHRGMTPSAYRRHR